MVNATEKEQRKVERKDKELRMSARREEWQKEKSATEKEQRKEAMKDE